MGSFFVIQHHLKLDFIAQRNAVDAKLGDFRFQFARDVERISMDSDKHKAALLIEAQGMQVVIGGDEPQASTAKVAGDVFYYFDQRGTDAKSRLNTIQGHDFAVVVLDVVGNQAYRLAIADGNKSREVMRVVDFIAAIGKSIES